MPASESAQSVQRFTEIWDKGRPRDRQRNNGDTPTARCCGPANGRSSPARGEGGFGGERVRRRRCSRPPRTRCRGAITPATAGAAVAVVRRPQSAAPIPIRCGGRFPRTILHGLCTYGIGRKAIVDTFLEGDVSRLFPPAPGSPACCSRRDAAGQHLEGGRQAAGGSTTTTPSRDDACCSPRWNLLRPRNSLHRRTRGGFVSSCPSS